MGVWRAVLQGFGLARQLWVALGAFLVVYAGTGALATLFIPFEVVEGRIRVPMPTNMAEALSRLIVGFGIYLIGIGFSLYVLGGMFGALQRLVRKQPVARGELRGLAGRWFWGMARWALAFSAITFGLGGAVALIVATLATAAGGTGAAGAIMQTAFSGTTVVSGLFLIFSPVVLVERALGAWASLRESCRIVVARPGATIGIVLCVSTVGALLYGLWLPVAAVINQIRAGLGIAPFAPGAPVFFFGLVLMFPQAFLSVYLPAVLQSYYYARIRAD